MLSKMYTYIVSTCTYISQKHADNEDYSDEENEETEMTDHITNLYFVANSVKKALEVAKTYDFNKGVVWWSEQCSDEKYVTEKFEMIRRFNPERPNMSITHEIGYIMKTPNIVGEYITITQLPLLD